MCLTNRTNCQIDELDAFKIFTRDKDGNLQSAFLSAVVNSKSYLPLYTANQQIRVDDENATFFALQSFDVAARIAIEGTSKWRVLNGRLLALPVTLYEVVAKGQFWSPSGDPQCLDGYYQAYESKEIVVHDSPENRAKFYDRVLEGWFRENSYRLTTIEKEAIRDRLPILAAHLKD
jgi:hypothetical protein